MVITRASQAREVGSIPIRRCFSLPFYLFFHPAGILPTRGHQVRVGICDPAKLADWARASGIENVLWLEALSLTRVVHSHRTGKTTHAFKLVGK